MKVKASQITPVIAVLTIVAIVATGIALGQVRNGAPWATLLGPARSFEESPDAKPSSEAKRVAVALSDASRASGGRTQLEIAQPNSSIQPAQAGARSTVVVQRPSTAPTVSDPGAHGDSSPRGTAEPGTSSGDPSPEVPEDGQSLSENGPGIGSRVDDQLRDSSSDRSGTAPEVEEQTVQVEEQTTEITTALNRPPGSARDEEDEEGAEAAPEAGASPGGVRGTGS